LEDQNLGLFYWLSASVFGTALSGKTEALDNLGDFRFSLQESEHEEIFKASKIGLFR
jgi:hypothetical protein